jgi:SAM-dependent methyltransferase
VRCRRAPRRCPRAPAVLTFVARAVILEPIENYDARVTAELQQYAECETVQELPSIHSVWTQGFVVPLLAHEGVANIDELWDREVAEQCARRAPEPALLVSLGAGNGEIELPLAARLAQRGVTNLEVVMLELNPVMIDRALAFAERLGIAERVRAEQADLNSWVSGEERVDVYLASHCLHHVVELEHLYDEIARSLDPDGVLLVNDMVGRNGHVRWPEAGEIVRRIWALLPESKRYNHPFQQVDERYPDLDCSTVGFEGIRSQDVLPLLLERLHPEIFLPFGNIVDPFVDRIYGPNFDPEDADDAAFIEAVARLDEAAIELGIVTPTHLLASFRPRPVACRHPRGRSPARMVREPDGASAGADGVPDYSEPVAAAVEALEALEALEAETRMAWSRYRELRARKVVRLGLALSDLGHRLLELVGSRR